MSTRLPSTESSSRTPHTTASLVGVIPQNTQPAFLPSSMYQARRRTPSEVTAAQTLATQVREDASALTLGIEVLSDGAFGTDNTAVLSCHGGIPQGFDYRFQVSGASKFWQSQADKDTPSDHVLDFATRMIDILRNKEKEIMKAASYTADTLGKPLKKGEKSPHARNAAVSIAALLESYYVAAAGIVGQNRKWKFRGTENEICSVESDATQASHVQEDTTPSLILPVELHYALDRREFDSFYRKFTKMDTPFSTFPVTWSGETTSFTLVEGEDDADKKNKARKAKRKSELDRKRHAAKGGKNPSGETSTGKRTLSPVTRDRSSESESQEPQAKRSRSASRERPTAEFSNGQAQQYIHIPPISPSYSEIGHGEFLAPPGSYASHSPSAPSSLILPPSSGQGPLWDPTASQDTTYRQGDDGFYQDYTQINGPLPLSSASHGQNLGQQLPSSDFTDMTLNLQDLTPEDNAALDAVAALMGFQTDTSQSTAPQPNPTEPLSSHILPFSDVGHTDPPGSHGGGQSSDEQQSSDPTRSWNPYSGHQ